jgi:carbon monoxide dehydrogenase subunit G
MKCIFLIVMVLPLLVGIAGCSVNLISLADTARTKGSGKKATENRNVPAFRRIALEGSGTLEVTVGDPQKVTLDFDDNLLSRVTTTVKNDTLIIGMKKGSYSSQLGLKVTVAVPALDGVEIDGSGSANVVNVKADHFDVEVSGSGGIAASGSADKVKVDISGSGRVELKDLRARDATVDVSGSGHLTVNATDSLGVDISGSGNVGYVGSPRIKKDVSGSGSVHPL